MTITSMFQPVDAVRAQPQLSAQLRGSAKAPTDPEVRWELGMAWRPEICPQAQGFDYCEDVADFPTVDSEDLVYYRPVGLRVVHMCPTRQVRDIDMDRARRQLEAATSSLLAAELWAGAITLANQYSTPTGSQTENYSFAYGGATVVTAPAGGFTSPALALGALDSAVREGMHGAAQAYLHMPSELAQLDPYNFRREGNLLLTEQDSIVVVDSGYPITGPNGASTAGTAWMFATGPVTVRLGDIQVIDNLGQTLDRNQNIREIWAQRLAAATFDPCTLYAVEVKLPS